MPRYRVEPHQRALFRGSERIRLMTMIVMLGVLGMLMARARDPQTWRWITRADEVLTPADLDAQMKEQAELARRAAAKALRARPLLAMSAGPVEAAGPAPNPKAAGNSAAAPAGLADDVPPPEPAEPRSTDVLRSSPLADDVPPPEPGLDPVFAEPPGGETDLPSAADISPGMQPESATEQAGATPAVDEPPVDLDPIELKEFDRVARAVTDKDSLRGSEMPAYWRLVDWEMQQKFSDLDKRSRKDLVFTHFWEHPDRYRGKLVQLKLQIKRAIATDADEQGRGRGLARTYEAWGFSEETDRPYVLVLTDLPPDFPLGYKIDENVLFDGFFLKLMKFEAGDNKFHAAPLLIGKIRWNPRIMPPMTVNPTWIWGGVLGGMAILMVIVRLTFNLRPLRPRSLHPPLRDDEPSIPIETWLDRAERAELPEPAPATPVAESFVHESEAPGDGPGHVSEPAAPDSGHEPPA